MNILYVTTKSPLPTNDGHSLRTYNLLCAAASKHNVFLLSFVKFPVEYEYLNDLKRICTYVRQFQVPENISKFRLSATVLINIFSTRPFVADKYYSEEMKAEMLRCIKEFDIDLVHLDMLPLGVYLDGISKPLLLNAHNIESKLLKRKVKAVGYGIAKLYFAIQAARLERFERMVVSRVDHVVVCSDEDRAILQLLVPGKKVSVIPNGVDIEFYRPDNKIKIKNGRLAFIGGMNWFPNKDAVIWFDREVIGNILKRDPSVILDLIGKSKGEMKLMNERSIIMHGFVDDIRPFLERAAVVVVPIRVGGGTRLKVLEAMSMGKAIVSTSVGIEGISLEHGKNVLVADTPTEFTDCVHKVLHDAALRYRLGAAARKLVASKYQWNIIGQCLLNAYEITVGRVHE